MRPRQSIAIVFTILFLAGCPTRPRHDVLPTVTITAPTAGALANGVVMVAVTVTGEPEVPLTLRVDGVVLAELPAPPYRVAWDTRTVAEGIHTLTAALEYGEESIPSPAVTIVVDRTPPEVTSISPTPASTNVALRAPITVSFSEPILPASLSPVAISLVSGITSVATRAVLGEGNRTLTITIDDPLSIPTPSRLTLAVTTALTDAAGNPLREAARSEWEVPDWIKLPPLGSVYPPAMALGPDGRPVIVYAPPATMGTHTIAVARFDGADWEFSLPASGSGIPAAEGYAIAVDGEGKVTIVWSDYAGEPSKTLRFNVWNGSAWTPTLPDLDARPGAGTNATQPSLRVDSAGRPAVSWIEAGEIFVARWTGSAWDRTPGGLGLTSATGNELLLDWQDRPIVGWNLGGTELGVSTWEGAWIASQTVPGSHRPAIALNPGGAPVMAVASGVSLRVLRLVNRAWSAETPQDLPIDAGDLNPRLAIDGARGPVTVRLRPSHNRLGFARWDAGSWDLGVPPFGNGGSLLPSTRPELSLDAHGTAWLAWQESYAAQVWMTNH